MVMLIRGKRVWDPELEERIKARSWYASSGSEASSLSDFVYGFLEADQEPASKDVDECNRANNDDDGDDCEAGRAANVAEALQALLNPYNDSDHPFLLRLYSQVVRTSEAFAGLRSDGSQYRRAVMARLRQVGYNAGVCKARWEGSGGLTAGNYEYIDIVINQNEKYIVDLEFASQFDVARATPEYEKLGALLPKVMVCRGERLRQVVRIMAEAARRSLKSKDLSVPPWRKSRYMLAKWFGLYRRTVNLLPSSAGAVVTGRGDVKCRSIGFKAAGCSKESTVQSLCLGAPSPSSPPPECRRRCLIEAFRKAWDDACKDTTGDTTVIIQSTASVPMSVAVSVIVAVSVAVSLVYSH